jgi:hypothetical protein
VWHFEHSTLAPSHALEACVSRRRQSNRETTSTAWEMIVCA